LSHPLRRSRWLIPAPPPDVNRNNNFGKFALRGGSSRALHHDMPVVVTLGGGMRRRDFITLFGGAATTWPLIAHAQRSKTPVVGLMGSTTADSYATRVAFIRQGLSETGYVEGRNLTIESRWADSQYDRLPGIAAELVSRRVDVIVAITTIAAIAAKAATTKIPIVFEAGGDPVSNGLVASLNPTGRESHGCKPVECRTWCKAARATASSHPVGEDIWLARQSDGADRQGVIEGRPSGRRKVGDTASYPGCKP
jgi:hypothetical protein